MAKKEKKKNNKIPRICSVSISGYKSIKSKTAIDIKPLTVLCGSNSSGKTSFFQPFLLLKQTQEINYNPEGLLLDGANVQVYDGSSLFSEKLNSARRNFSIGFSFSDGSEVRNFYKYKENVNVFSCDIKINEEKYKISKKTSLKKLEEFYKNDSFAKQWLYWTSKNSKNDKRKKSRDMMPKILGERGFLKQYVQDDNAKFRIEVPFSGYMKRCSSIENFLGLYHIPGIRGNPERYYKISSSKNYFGRFEDYTASIINYWQNSKDKEEQKKLEKLGGLLNRMGLTTFVKSQKVNDVNIQINVGALPNVRNRNIQDINIADVGFGVSQVLPILIALLQAEKGRIVYIEQPELHLHPKSQEVLAEILCEFATSGIKVLIETHSSIILRKIQTMIAKKKIDFTDVGFNWFSMGSDGFTKVAKADLDEKGRLGDWPQDFDDIYMGVESEFIESQF